MSSESYTTALSQPSLNRYPSYVTFNPPSSPQPEITTINITTVIFLILAIGIAAIALVFGVIAYQQYVNLQQRNQQIANTFRLEVVTTDVTVDELTDTNYLQLVIPLKYATNPINLVTGVYLRKSAGNTIIGNYPFVAQLNNVRLTIPKTLALSSGIVLQVLGPTSGYAFNYTQWSAIVSYKTSNNS